MTKNLGNLFIAANSGIVDATNTHTIINNGVTLSENVSKFGTKALFFDGASNLEILDSDDWYIEGNYTIDLWAYSTEIKTIIQTLVSQWRYGGGTDRSFDIRLGEDDNNFKATVMLQPSSIYLANDAGVSPQASTWTHLAFVVENGYTKLYVNGVLKNTSSNFQTDANNSNTNLSIGSLLNSSNVPIRYFTGYMDNIRITKGTALWTENFDSTTTTEMLYPVPVPASSVYNVGHRGNLRGEAKAGYIRPTIKESFTSANFKYIEKMIPTELDINKSGSVTLTNDNHTANFTANAENSLTVDGVSAGKYYWEIEVIFTTASYGRAIAMGVSNNTYPGYNGYINARLGTSSIHMVDDATEINVNGTQTQSGLMPLPEAGTYVYGLALNLDDNELTFYVDGTKVGNTTDISSITSSLPLYAFVEQSERGAEHTTFNCNFGQKSFTYQEPAGFAKGFGYKNI